jgi:hypothetical protein
MTMNTAPVHVVDTLEAAALRNRAARESGCDTCAKGCDCEVGSGGCEHYGCWGANRRRNISAKANTCPAYVAAHRRLAG